MYLLLRLTSAIVVLTSTTVLADDERDCLKQTDPQLRLKSCSQLIQHDQLDATAYQNRAVAYGLTGDLDRAIADYTKAIEIKPNNTTAYESRGRAYASKGDYVSAIADAQKASELAAASETKAVTPKAPKPGVVAPVQHKKGAVAQSSKARVSQAKPVANPASEDGWSGWATSLRDKSAD